MQRSIPFMGSINGEVVLSENYTAASKLLADKADNRWKNPHYNLKVYVFGDIHYSGCVNNSPAYYPTGIQKW